MLLVDCVLHADDRFDSMLDHTCVQRENSVPAESATEDRFSIPLELRGIADDRRPMERRACLAVIQGMIDCCCCIGFALVSLVGWSSRKVNVVSNFLHLKILFCDGFVPTHAAKILSEGARGTTRKRELTPGDLTWSQVAQKDMLWRKLASWKRQMEDTRQMLSF